MIPGMPWLPLAQYRLGHPQGAMALLLGELPGVEQVELDPAGDADDAGLAGIPGGEVAGLLGFPGLARSGRSRVKKPGRRILARNGLVR